MSAPRPVDQTQADIDQALREYDAGNMQAARTSAERLLAQQPDNHAILCLAAGLATAEQRFGDAQQLYQRSLAAAQSSADKAKSWAGLGKLGKAAGDPDTAEECGRRAVMADPSAVEHMIEFSDILASRGKVDSAVEVLRNAMNRFPRDPNPCITLGNLLLTVSGRHKDALALYDIALQRDPNSSSAHFNASVALIVLGKIDAARTACENALKLAPDMAGYYQLANLGGLSADDPRIPSLESRAEDPRTARDLRVDASFALAVAFNDADDPDRAFPHLHRANVLKRSTLEYDIHDDEERMDRIAKFFTADFFRRFAGVSSSPLAPIFILGMPRSGSTLLEQMLAAHSQVRAGGELPHMATIAQGIGATWGERGEASPGSDEQVKADFRQAVADYTQATVALQGKEPHFTDKLPGNFMFIGLIHLMFPAARIIHCRRDPVDSCLSSYQRQFSSQVPYSYDLAELGHYYRLYQKLMNHWQRELPPGCILDVDYEAVVASPEIELRKILDFCGLDFEDACLDFHSVKRSVSTASAVQVRNPLYKTSVHRWKKYAAYLGPLLTALEIDPTAT